MIYNNAQDYINKILELSLAFEKHLVIEVSNVQFLCSFIYGSYNYLLGIPIFNTYRMIINYRTIH